MLLFLLYFVDSLLHFLLVNVHSRDILDELLTTVTTDEKIVLDVFLLDFFLIVQFLEDIPIEEDVVEIVLVEL